MAYIHRCLISLLFCASSSYAAEPGEIDLAGWIKNESGTYTKAFSDSNGTSRITLNSPPTGLSTTSTAMIQTSKGLQSFDITKTADVDVSRVGKAVRALAVLGGPVGMAITAASLVCELTDICNVDGVFKTFSSPTGTAAIETHVGWCINNGGGAPCYPDKNYRAAVQAANACFAANPSNCEFGDSQPRYNAGTLVGLDYRLRFKSDGSYSELFQGTMIGTFVPPVPTSTPTTTADWNAKESLLNDARFVPELNDKGIPIPTTGIPTLNPNQKARLGVESTPTKDAQGNVTGRQETVTEIEAIDAGTTEKPGKVIIKETVTKIQYDNNNTQISSNTSTSYSSQPQTENKPQTFEIKFDEVPPAELPTHNVQATFSSTSWGEGTCPPDIDVALSGVGHTFTIPTQPICDTAIMINPFILLLASIAGIYIVSGVRSTEAK
ncbi:MAG: hypothetical protein KA524_07540 [Nitrosomonas sp.]|nr:hypothetical protein [Nitrosomonas sp.]MBP6076034.1 hypothetical protein [Nitrosomonas sp.]